MDPFITEFHRTLPHAEHFFRQILGWIGLLFIIGAALVFVIHAVMRRWRSVALNDPKTYVVVFARGNARAKRKSYDFESLMIELRKVFRSAAVSHEGMVNFHSIEAVRFLVSNGVGESIGVTASTAEEMAGVYWELIPILGRVPEGAWTGGMELGTVLRIMQDFASQHRSQSKR